MTKTGGHRPAMLLAATVLLWACGPNKLVVRRSRDGQELKTYRLRSLTGLRDGDRFGSELVVGDNDGALTMRMKFQIGVPTKLESGSYVWRRKDEREISGAVKAVSVIFQGGQDGPPSLGGSYELASEGVSLYQVQLPPTRVDSPGRTAAPEFPPAPAAAKPVPAQ